LQVILGLLFDSSEIYQVNVLIQLPLPSIHTVALVNSVYSQNCRNALQTAVGQSAATQWVDEDTPNDACTKTLAPNNEKLTLVFSDEFQKSGRKFAAKDRDPKWTAEDLYYFPTNNVEIVKPSQVKTENGKAVITIDKCDRCTAKLQNATTFEIVGWQSDYVSGFMTSWNKFCYTGGYIEGKAKLPGDDKRTGFWPAFWTMGNLGRAGHLCSTSGMWPYSYDGCPAKNGDWSKLNPQNITECADPFGFDRTKYGLLPNQGRGSPEFDVFEVTVTSKEADPDNIERPPTASQTLQMAPQNPPNMRDWPLIGGVSYPGQDTKFSTRNNGYFSGNAYQDSISALSDLDETFFTDFHTYGVDWSPGKYLRWYIDGEFLYEIDAEVLKAQSTPDWNIMARTIPLEPMYIIFNLGMSPDFSNVPNKEEFEKVYLPKLDFPNHMEFEYIRVYQRPSEYNVGCSPPAYPTQEYIACFRDKYTTKADDAYLIKGSCPTTPPQGVCSNGGVMTGVVGVLVAYVFALLF
jgi:beta-glucanase (GH16 family)